MKTLGVWVEVTTLVVPGLNDGPEELAAIARFIASVDPDMPWHISRFHPDYEYTEAPATPVSTLRTAADAGRREGLRHIYVGNVPGELEDTACPTCRTVLIRRRGFAVVATRFGIPCPRCLTLPDRSPEVLSVGFVFGTSDIMAFYRRTDERPTA
jgi:pyruvate formate lyase activating enzyme